MLIYIECGQDGRLFTAVGCDRKRVDRSLVRKPDAMAEEPFQKSQPYLGTNAGRAALMLAAKKLLR